MKNKLRESLFCDAALIGAVCLLFSLLLNWSKICIHWIKMLGIKSCSFARMFNIIHLGLSWCLICNFVISMRIKHQRLLSVSRCDLTPFIQTYIIADPCIIQAFIISHLILKVEQTANEVLKFVEPFWYELTLSLQSVINNLLSFRNFTLFSFKTWNLTKNEQRCWLHILYLYLEI